MVRFKSVGKTRRNAEKKEKKVIVRLGRPPSMDDKKIVKLTELFASGVTIRAACDYVGINPDTYYEWMRKGDDERALCVTEEREPVTEMLPYVTFAERIHQARAHFEVGATLLISTKAQKDPNWAAYMLKCKNKEWNPSQQIDQTLSAGGGNVTVVIRDATPDDAPRNKK